MEFRSILKFVSLTKKGLNCEYVLEIDLEEKVPKFKMIEQIEGGFSAQSTNPNKVLSLFMLELGKVYSNQ